MIIDISFSDGGINKIVIQKLFLFYIICVGGMRSGDDQVLAGPGLARYVESGSIIHFGADGPMICTLPDGQLKKVFVWWTEEPCLVKYFPTRIPRKLPSNACLIRGYLCLLHCCCECSLPASIPPAAGPVRHE